MHFLHRLTVARLLDVKRSDKIHQFPLGKRGNRIKRAPQLDGGMAGGKVDRVRAFAYFSLLVYFGLRIRASTSKFTRAD